MLATRTNGVWPLMRPLGLFRDNLFRDFDSLFNTNTEQILPEIDMQEEGNAIKIRANMPGISKENLDISLEGTILTIRGKQEQKREEKGSQFLVQERYTGAFARSIQLPSEVNPNKVEASLKDGVLEIQLQRDYESQKKQIEVK